jgi:diketogulonate reductase-like aldo/keto reductase
VARETQKSVEEALACGYRHIDTAYTYHNQDLVGAAIRAAGVVRDEVFVTSKLHPDANSYSVAWWKIKEAIRLIFGKADPAGAYLDCFLIHFPGRGNPLRAWDALREARDEGLLKHIGVSNFEIRHLLELRNHSGEYPELNQIEFHPFIYSKQRNLLEFCREKGIAVEGYCPMAQGLVVRNPTMCRIAEAHHETPGRIALQWAMRHGVRPIVGSRNADHIRANAVPYAFTLTPDETQALDQIGARHSERISLRWNWDPTTAPLGTADWGASIRLVLHRLSHG